MCFFREKNEPEKVEMDLELSQLPNLLRAKNRCLSRFRDLSQEFIDQTSVGGFATLDSALPAFETGREAIVNAIDLYDRRVSQTLHALEARHPGLDIGQIPLATELREELRELMKVSEALMAEILAVDDQVALRIQGGKAELQAELAAHEKNRTAAQKLRKFRSSWVPEAGEGLDHKL